MILRTLATCLSLAVVSLTLAAQSATAADFAVLNYNSGLQAFTRTSAGFTIGSKITIGGSNIIINSLGAQFLSGATSISVGLWNEAGNTQFATATVQNTSPLYNGYRYADLGQNFTLNANTVYILGAYLPSGATFYDGNDNTGTDFNTAPYSGNTGVTLTKEQYEVGGALQFPAQTDNTATSIPGRWGPANAAFITPVPEPSTYALGTIAAATIAWLARRKRMARA